MNLKIYTKYLLLIVICICFVIKNYSRGLTSIGSHHIIGLSYQYDCILSFGGMAAGNYYSNLTVQAGFAFNDYLAIQLGYHNFTANPYEFSYNLINYTDYTNDHFAHTAVGLFHPIPIKDAKNKTLWEEKGKWYNPRHILFDVYVGYGKGLNLRSLELSEFNSSLAALPITPSNDFSSNSTINFNKWYAEAGLHYKGHVFGASLSGLLGILNFRRITVRGLPDEDLDSLISLFEQDNNHYTYGIQFQLSVSFDAFTLLYHNHQNYIIGQDYLTYTLNDYFGELSVQLNLNQVFKKKEKR